MYASAEPVIVETVLGSCIAACLYDPIHQVGGMNHFLLPRRCQGDPNLARYGEYAMQMLIDRVVKLGGKKSDLRAMVFGAASVLKMDETRYSVPRANESFVREFLSANSIPLLGELVGGDQPIKVRMSTNTGKSVARVLPRTQLDTVVTDEGKQYAATIARRFAWFEDGTRVINAGRTTGAKPKF